MTLVDDRPTWQLDVTYSPDPLVGWVPRSWEYIIRAGTGIQILESGRRTVSQYELNVSIADREFDINLPHGSRVIDMGSGKEVQYVIKEDGGKGRAIPVTANPTYEDLQKAEPRSMRRIAIGGAAVLLAVSILMILWWRWRRNANGSADLNLSSRWIPERQINHAEETMFKPRKWTPAACCWSCWQARRPYFSTARGCAPKRRLHQQPVQANQILLRLR